MDKYRTIQTTLKEEIDKDDIDCLDVGVFLKVGLKLDGPLAIRISANFDLPDGELEEASSLGWVLYVGEETNLLFKDGKRVCSTTHCRHDFDYEIY